MIFVCCKITIVATDICLPFVLKSDVRLATHWAFAVSQNNALGPNVEHAILHRLILALHRWVPAVAKFFFSGQIFLCLF